MERISTVVFATATLAFGLMAQPGPGGRGPQGGGPGFGRRGFGPAGMMGPGVFSRTPVTGAPFMGVETVQRHEPLANGNSIDNQHQSKVWRDGQGRTRIEETFTPPGSTTAQTRIMISDPVAGYAYFLNPTTSTAVKRQIPAPRSGTTNTDNPPTHTPPGATVSTDNLGTQVVNGLSATGTKNTVTIAAGTHGNAQPMVTTREVWTSTVLKVPVKVSSTDPRGGTHDMNLTVSSQNEPDPALFQVPSTYTVKTGGAGMRAMPGGAPHQ